MPNDQPAYKVSGAEVELLEYKLADKVQERVLSRAKYIVVPFLAGLTLLGLLGTPYMIEFISNKVVRDIQMSMEKESEVLRRRLSETLANLNVSSAEILKTTEQAKAQLKRLEQDYASIEALNNRYSAVRSEVSRIENELRQTNEAVLAAKKSTESLAKAVVETSAGRPAFLAASYRWDGPEESLSHIQVSGTNLGDRPGRVRVQFVVRSSDGDAGVRSDFVPIDAASIRTWRNDKVDIEASPSLQRQFATILKGLASKLPRVHSKGATFELTTSNGVQLTSG